MPLLEKVHWISKIIFCHQTAMVMANQRSQNESYQVNNPASEVPWHAAYPAPRSAVTSLGRQDVLRWFQNGRKVGKDFVLIDVRRTDFEVLYESFLRDTCPFLIRL